MCTGFEVIKIWVIVVGGPLFECVKVHGDSVEIMDQCQIGVRTRRQPSHDESLNSIGMNLPVLQQQTAEERLAGMCGSLASQSALGPLLRALKMSNSRSDCSYIGRRICNESTLRSNRWHPGASCFASSTANVLGLAGDVQAQRLLDSTQAITSG